MSYHIPYVGEKVVFINSEGRPFQAVVSRVVDVGEGTVEFGGEFNEYGVIRYVDPAGATQYHVNSWHFENDDTSKIDKTLFRVKQPSTRPEQPARSRHDPA